MGATARAAARRDSSTAPRNMTWHRAVLPGMSVAGPDVFPAMAIAAVFPSEAEAVRPTCPYSVPRAGGGAWRGPLVAWAPARRVRLARTSTPSPSATTASSARIRGQTVESVSSTRRRAGGWRAGRAAGPATKERSRCFVFGCRQENRFSLKNGACHLKYTHHDLSVLVAGTEPDGKCARPLRVACGRSSH